MSLYVVELRSSVVVFLTLFPASFLLFFSSSSIFTPLLSLFQPIQLLISSSPSFPACVFPRISYSPLDCSPACLPDCLLARSPNIIRPPTFPLLAILWPGFSLTRASTLSFQGGMVFLPGNVPGCFSCLDTYHRHISSFQVPSSSSTSYLLS